MNCRLVYLALFISTLSLGIILWDKVAEYRYKRAVPVSVDEFMTHKGSDGKNVFIWGFLTKENGIFLLHKDKEFSELKNPYISPISIWVSDNDLEGMCEGSYVIVHGKMRPTLYGPGIDNIFYLGSLKIEGD